MKIPKTITINGIVFNLYMVRNQPYVGQAKYMEGAIRLNMDYTVSRLKSVLMHEILETIAYSMNCIEFRDNGVEVKFIHMPQVNNDNYINYTDMVYDTIFRNKLDVLCHPDTEWDLKEYATFQAPIPSGSVKQSKSKVRNNVLVDRSKKKLRGKTK